MNIQLVSIFLKAKQTRIKLGRDYPQFFTVRFFQTKKREKQTAFGWSRYEIHYHNQDKNIQCSEF